MANGNGKMTVLGEDSGVLEGQRGFEFIDIDLAKAIQWLRFDDRPRHASGCQCQRCTPARELARAAVRDSTCTCGWCPVCWVADQLKAGRL
jgi:hypothetical protein